MVGSLGYYGSVGRHLLISTNANQANGPTASPSPRPFLTLSANSPIRPGASINSNIAERNSISSSNYNAMWATIAKSFSHGIEFNANYVWAKSMDINSLGSQGGANLEDSNNPALNYGLSDFDVRNRLAGTVIYNLPFHRNRFVDGFRLESILQYQTGNPVNIVASSDGYNGNTGLIRPSLLGPLPRQSSSCRSDATSRYFPEPPWANVG